MVAVWCCGGMEGCQRVCVACCPLAAHLFTPHPTPSANGLVTAVNTLCVCVCESESEGVSRRDYPIQNKA